MVRLAAALADQLDSPARARDPLSRKLERGHAADPPPARGRRRNGQRILAAAPPAPQHQDHGRIVLGGELEAAGGGHAGAADLADDRGQAAMPQPLLHHRQRILVAAAFGVDDAAGREASLRESRGEQVAPADHPQHLPVRIQGAGSDSGREQGRRRIVVEAGAASRQLVERGDRQAAARQPLIHLIDPEGQGFSRPRAARGFDGPDFGAQILKARMMGWQGCWHDSYELECSLYVPLVPSESQPSFREIRHGPVIMLNVQRGPHHESHFP